MTLSSFLVIMMTVALALGFLGVICCIRSSQCSRIMEQAAAQSAQPEPEQRLRRSA